MADDQAIRTIEELTDAYRVAIDQCARRHLLIQEALALDVTFKEKLQAALTPGSPAHREFDRSIRETFHGFVGIPGGYVAVQDVQRFQERLALLGKLAEYLRPGSLPQAGFDKRQHHITAGDLGHARLLLFRLMKEATSDLLIVDAYADESVFDYLDSLADGLRVRVLGERKLSPAVKLILDGYQQQGRLFEARRGKAIHDRYLVIDGMHMWSLGASINGFGSKAHTLTQIVDDVERKKMIAEFESAWSSGTPL